MEPHQQHRGGGSGQRSYHQNDRGGQRGDRGGGNRGRGGGGQRGGRRAAQDDVNLDNRRQRTIIRDGAEKFFKDNEIPEGDTLLEEKMPPGTVAKSIETFESNAFGVKFQENGFKLHQYHVEMSAKKTENSKKAFLFTKRSNDDCVAVDRKTRCRDVFNIIKQIRPDIFDPSHTFYYDLQSTLMATKELPLHISDKQIFINFNPAQFPNFYSIQPFAKVTVIIKQSETDTVLTSNDMTMANLSDLAQFDRKQQSFIELATSQFSLFHPEDIVCLADGKLYLMSPEKTMDNGIVQRCNNFSSDKFLAFGCKKSAKYIEGPHGQGHANVALFISPMKTPFFREQTIL